jgi:hypothetical protein
MTKDARYRAAKYMIEANNLDSFEDIFKKKIISRTAVADDLGMNHNRFKRIVKYPGQMTLNEILELSRLLGYPYEKLVLFLAREVKSAK